MQINEMFSNKLALPLNRKEKFYTATVLPGIICADDMRKFFGLLGRADVCPDLRPVTANTQIFTEYDLRDAVRGDAGSTWHDLLGQLSGDTPDVMILVDTPERLLICIEAKFFTHPSAQSLRAQMARQRTYVVDPVRSKVGCKVLHVALVTASLREELNGTKESKVEDTVLSWDEIADTYSCEEKAAYWVALLKYALDRQPDLRAVKKSSSGHWSRKMTTAAILEAFASPGCTIRYVGAHKWKNIRNDLVATGGMTRPVAVSDSETCPGSRYMSIENFVETVRCWRAIATCAGRPATRSGMAQ